MNWLKNLLRIVSEFTVEILKSPFELKNIYSSYEIFLKLFSAFCDLVKYAFFVSAFAIGIGFMIYDNKKDIFIILLIWAAAFIAFYAAIGLMSTLVVISERLNSNEISKELPYNIAKIVIIKASAPTESTSVSLFGERQYRYCEGYAILDTVKYSRKVLIQRISITFEEVAAYEYAASIEKRIGKAVIDRKENKNSFINIKIPVGSNIFNKSAEIDLASCNLILYGEIAIEGDGQLVYYIEDFNLMRWRSINPQIFKDSLSKISSEQKYSEACEIVNEVSEYLDAMA
jgi:hypothetical protein